MTRRLWFLVFATAVAAAGCDSSSTPTSATAIAPSAPPAYHTLSGVVSTVTGGSATPVEGARVEVAEGCRPGQCVRFAMTDQDGRYRIPDVLAGNRAIVVSKWGHASILTTVTLTGDMELDLQMVREEIYTLSGVVFEVTAAGLAPVERVWVYCDACGDGGHMGTFTDGDGAYEFREVQAGLFAILAHKDGYTVVDSTRTSADGTGERTVRVSGDTHFDIQLVRR